MVLFLRLADLFYRDLLHRSGNPAGACKTHEADGFDSSGIQGTVERIWRHFRDKVFWCTYWRGFLLLWPSCGWICIWLYM